jgi:hypothetical protein
MYKYKIIIEGEAEDMSQVTAGPFTLNVQPAAVAPNPIGFSTSSGPLPQETEGKAVAGDLVTTISGGTPPYTVSAPTGVPAGMSLSATPSADGKSSAITIDGTPAVGDSTGGDGKGNYSIGFTVTDSALASAKFGA